MARSPELVLQILQEAGVRHLLGIPGGASYHIFNALYDKQDKIQPILVRHEQVAAIMADAYARATGKLAAILGQGVFMGSNASFGIMEAYASSSPMLILTDTYDEGFAQHPANQSGAGEYGSIDLLNIFRAMTKYTTLATNPKEAVLGTQLAIKHALTGRPGPACVLMRRSAMIDEVPLESPPFLYPTKGYLNTTAPQASSQDVERAVRMLVEARNPVIVAGHGVRMARAGELVARLAETLGIPVATTFKGKSLIEETHQLAVGMTGVFGQRVAHACISQADVVLIIGAKMTPLDTIHERPELFDPKRQKIIQIDIDARNAGWTFPVELGLVGDAHAVTGQLIEAAKLEPATKKIDVAGRLKRIQGLKNELNYFGARDVASAQDSSPVKPQRLVRILQGTLDPSSLITLDAGNNRIWVCYLYTSRQKNTFFAPGGIQGMGWALPAALGLKLAHPERPVVAIGGDGGFMMNIHALSTAVQYNLPVVSVIMNDSALGMVRHSQQRTGRKIACEFVKTDFAALARGFGAQGVHVEDSRELPQVLREAQASGQPTVIDVTIDREPEIASFRADQEEYAKKI